MPAKICGPFEVKLTPQPSNIEHPDPTLGRMTIAKTYQGDLEAVGTPSLSIRPVEMTSVIRTGLPPLVGPGDRVVLFDGVCNLCNGSVQFILRFDRLGTFRLAAIQSPEGQAIMRWFGLPAGMSGTMLLVEGGRVSTKSTAVLRIGARLPFPWWLSGVGWIVPRVVRDWIYDIVARNRYRWFGRREVCLVPGPEHDGRFLTASDPTGRATS